jgi:[acyl-carrier-protein] S-malonyltransferase
VALAYILGGGLNDQPDTGQQLYEHYERVRATYQDVAAWTGILVDQLVQGKGSQGPDPRIGSIRQAAAVVGTYDLLADYGIYPAAVAGLSLGGLIGASLAGALDRRDLFRFLMQAGAVPTSPAGSPAQGLLLLSLPAGEDTSRFYAMSDHQVYPVADLGAAGSGREQILILGGLRDALVALTAQLPAEWIQRTPEHSVAFHTPLQQHVREQLDPVIDGLAFRDPLIPVCSCFEPEILTSAESIRAMFRRNAVDPVSVPHMRYGLEQVGIELGIVLGPSQFDRYLRSPFPLVHIEAPEHVAEAISSIHDLGVLLTPAPVKASRQ